MITRSISDVVEHLEGLGFVEVESIAASAFGNESLTLRAGGCEFRIGTDRGQPFIESGPTEAQTWFDAGVWATYLGMGERDPAGGDWNDQAAFFVENAATVKEVCECEGATAEQSLRAIRRRRAIARGLI